MVACGNPADQNGGSGLEATKQIPVTGATPVVELAPPKLPASSASVGGAVLQVSMSLNGDWGKPTSMVNSLGSLFTYLFNLAGQQQDLLTYQIHGQVCAANHGKVPTQGLNLSVQVEYQVGGLDFIPMHDALFQLTPDQQLGGGESHCYDYQLQFTPLGQDAQYRAAAMVVVDNQTGWLAGSSNCSGQKSCPYGVRVTSDFVLQPQDTSTATVVPTAGAVETVVPYQPEIGSSNPGSHPTPTRVKTKTPTPKPTATPAPPNPPPSQPTPKPTSPGPSPVHTPRPTHAPRPTQNQPPPVVNPKPTHAPKPTRAPKPTHVPKPPHPKK
jgi:hypothetical protein